jgi:4-amino-4-deoxy-L-arabinose transferase-like glycosyltransferase
MVAARVPSHPRSYRWSRANPLDALLGAALSFALVLALILTSRGTPSDSDDIQYHIPNAAAWVHIHDLWHLPVADPGYFTNAYPSDGELLTSWIIQPFHGGELSSWPTLVFGVLILLAGAMIAEQLGRSASAGLLGAAAIVLSPISWQTQVHSALTDWTSASGLLAAVAFLLRARERGETRWLLLAGVALGLAVGSKDTAVLPAVAVILFALLVLPRVARWRSLPLLAIGLVGLAGLWYVRTWIQTGNPIYPEPVRIGGSTLFGGASSPLTKYSASLAHDVVTNDHHPLREWVHLVHTLVGPPAILSIAVITAFWRPLRRRALALTAALAVLLFATYLVTPYTGPNVSILIGSQLRYAIPAFVLAAICACAAFPWVQLIAWIGIGADLVTISKGASFTTNVNVSKGDLAAAALVALIVGLVLLRTRLGNVVLRPRDPTRTWAGAGTVALAGVVAVAALAVHRAPAHSNLDTALDGVGKGSGTVMVIGDTNVLEALGSKLDHRVIAPGTGRAGEVPITDPVALDRAIAADQPSVVLLGPDAAPGVIPDWTPPGYKQFAITGANHEYVRVTG